MFYDDNCVFVTERANVMSFAKKLSFLRWTMFFYEKHVFTKKTVLLRRKTEMQVNVSTGNVVVKLMQFTLAT